MTGLKGKIIMKRFLKNIFLNFKMFCFFAINLVGSPRGDGDYIVEMWMGITLHYIGDGEMGIYIGGKKLGRFTSIGEKPP